MSSRQTDLTPVGTDDDVRSRFRAVKFGDEAASVIRALILDRDLSAGERLNEVALSVKLGISRSPIREALNALAGEGFVTLVPGRGAFVPTYTNEDVRELGEVRQALEVTAARFAAVRATDAELAEIGALLASTEAALTQSPTTYPLTLDFHALVVRMAGNDNLAQVSMTVLSKVRLARVLSGQNLDRARTAYEEHRTIFNALRDRDQDGAGLAMQSHLEHAVFSAQGAVDGASNATAPSCAVNDC